MAAKCHNHSPKMKKSKLYLPILAAILTITACDEETSSLGSDMMPTADLTTQISQEYDVTTQSYTAGDSVLARSTTSYLGQFTDPETGTEIMELLQAISQAGTTVLISTHNLNWIERYQGRQLHFKDGKIKELQ